MKELRELLKRMSNEGIDSKVKFNNGKCKVNCNCIEIAEDENSGNPVKNYACLGIDESGLADLKE